VSENAKHASVLWNLRERISVALKHAGAGKLFLFPYGQCD
jgi:hypothetical protein